MLIFILITWLLTGYASAQPQQAPIMTTEQRLAVQIANMSLQLAQQQTIIDKLQEDLAQLRKEHEKKVPPK
jgi:uncharacterized coiled-coil protein SlyX